jgi:hypothetical protein
METSVDEKDHARPSHEALNTDVHETEEQTADRRMNEIANKAAGKGLARERRDGPDIFTK